MIIVDANIISELIKQVPDQNVLDWLDHQEPQILATTAITVAELRYGTNSMPAGKRQAMLDGAITDMLEEDFRENILAFDTAAAEAFGILAARLRKQGTPVGQNDTMIAAIALVHEATLLTRNNRHFKQCGLDVVNPFAA